MEKINTYQIDLTLREIETLERAMMTYQNHIREYSDEIRNEEQIEINSIINKVNKA